MKANIKTHFLAMHTALALTMRKMGENKFTPEKIILCISAFLFIPSSAICQQLDWSMGGYAGQYYDTEPARFYHNDTNYLNQYCCSYGK
jgi:hypothetical protein